MTIKKVKADLKKAVGQNWSKELGRTVEQLASKYASKESLHVCLMACAVVAGACIDEWPLTKTGCVHALSAMTSALLGVPLMLWVAATLATVLAYLIFAIVLLAALAIVTIALGVASLALVGAAGVMIILLTVYFAGVSWLDK